jgi:ubiquinol oxidase
MINLDIHHKPENLSDRIALGFTKLLRFIADKFFKKKYGHRAVVLETVAAIPGMVGGMLIHLKSVRRIKEDKGWIKTLLDEAENERMHLMTFINIAQPTMFERFLIMFAQFIFIVLYLFIYLISPKTAHRIVGYFEEEAVISYSQYLKEVEDGKIENIKAPKIAIDYWNLPLNSKLKDVIKVVRDDEAGHRDVNHSYANILNKKEDPNEEQLQN